MKKVLVFAIALLCATSWADQEVDRILDVNEDVHVRIDNTAGEVIVRAWDKNQVQIKGTLDERVKELRVNARSSSVDIEVVLPRHKRGKKIQAFLVIDVPGAADLTVDTVSARIEVADILGKVELDSVSGGVEMEGRPEKLEIDTVSGRVEVAVDTSELSIDTTSGRIEVEGNAANVTLDTTSGSVGIEGTFGKVQIDSISGSIEVEATFEELSAESVSGRIQASKVARRVVANSVSGRIRIEGEALARAELETVSGSIDLKAGLAPGGEIEIDTHSGSVDLDLPADVDARFDVNTFSGGITTDFGSPERQSRFGPGLELECVQGAGNGRVEVETLSGSVRIRGN